MRIREVILQANSLDAIKAFYRDILELPILHESSEQLSIAVGASVLTFTQSMDSSSPYYHFAFNITETKTEEALQWLKSKGIEMNTIDGQDRYYSQSWNSDSLYFQDPAGNIVEFIARHNIAEDKQGEFTSSDIKNISEIGFGVENVGSVAALLQSRYGLEVYKSASDNFAALGDEEGLFILSGLNRNWLSSNKTVEVFPMVVEINSSTDRVENLLKYPYTIRETADAIAEND